LKKPSVEKACAERSRSSRVWVGKIRRYLERNTLYLSLPVARCLSDHLKKPSFKQERLGRICRELKTVGLVNRRTRSSLSTPQTYSQQSDRYLPTQLYTVEPSSPSFRTIDLSMVLKLMSTRIRRQLDH